MNVVDDVLLDVTERCCRRVQLLTGRSNVWLAVQLTNLSIVVYFLWVASFFVISTTTIRVVMTVFSVGLVYLLGQTVFKVSVEAAEQNAYRRVARGLRNPRRMRDALLRTLFLVLSVVLLGPVLLVYQTLEYSLALLTYSLIVLTTVLLYVIACDPLPPSAGKIQQWVAAAFGRPAPATGQEAAAPVPSERRFR